MANGDRMNGASNSWSRWAAVLFVSLISLTAGLTAFQVRVDPLDVWEAPRAWGINNWKFSQWTYDRLYKSYQIQNHRARVVIVGTSRAIIGYPGYWPKARPGEVYNFGLSGLHIPELAVQTEFLLDTRSPEVMVFALEPLMFSDLEITPKPGFSKTRIRMISGSPITRLAYKLKETVFNWTVIKHSMTTLRNSRILPKEVFCDRNGWAQYRGRELRTLRDPYILNTWTYLTYIYRGLSLSARSVADFGKTLERTRKRGTDVVVLMNPLSADFLLLLEANKKRPLLDALKRQLVEMTPFWDFAYVNPVTEERTNYIDGAHFNGQVGRYVLDRAGGNAAAVPPGFGVYLTQDNINRRLAQQASAFRRFKKENAAALDVFREELRDERKALFTEKISQIVRFGG